MQTSASSAASLTSISESLFGPTQKCPKLKSQSSSSSTEEEAYQIDLAKLRRVCSQGIADEGSHRGVAWRVLLGYLDPDLGKWPQEIPKQRDQYLELVKQYFEGPLERGKDLRGQLSKLLRDRRLRKKFNKLESWDNPQDNHDNDDSDSVVSEQTLESSQSTMRFQPAQKILDRLPTKEFQDAWKKSGIDLDAGNSEFTNQVVNLGINQLKISPNMTLEEFEAFKEDAKLLCEVRKDVARTHPDLFFYLEPKDHLGMRRYGAMERILFIWAKLNKGVSIGCIVDSVALIALAANRHIIHSL